MISIVFYFFYILLLLSVPFILFGKKNYLILFVLILCAQFNVTSFFKLGITFSFFEVALFTSVFFVLVFKSSIIKRIRYNNIDRVFFLFLLISFLSIIIASIRISIRDLIPSFDYLDTPPLLRSIMSLNKVIIFVPMLIVIRTFLNQYWSSSFLNERLLVFFIYAGILPCCAVLLQFLGIGFDLIHNNPSFGQDFEIINYIVDRPVGLTNEASFFVYQLFFSFVALFEANRFKLISKKTFFILFVLFIGTVILSLSRSGLIFYALFLALYQFRDGVKVSRLIFISCLFGALYFFVQNVTIYGFNIIDRLLSSFDTQSDLSTIERYGSSSAILQLALDKAQIVGVGVYNYGYYAMSYLPDYMSVIHYTKEKTLPSFNFVLQLLAEFGSFLFLFLFLKGYFLIKATNIYFVRMFFLFLVLYAMTFQILNFAVPFLILLYSPDEEDSIYN